MAFVSVSSYQIKKKSPFHNEITKQLETVCGNKLHLIKHLKNTKLYSIEFLRTEMTSDPSNRNREYEP